MGNVIRLCDRVPVDPILRKGDTVKIVDTDEFFPEAWHQDGGTGFEGAYAIVTEILMVFPEAHEFAPGQAAYVNLAIPYDSDWHEIEDVSTSYIHRVLGENCLASDKGYEK